MRKKKSKNKEAVVLNDQEYAKLLQNIQEFEENFYALIAGTNRFEIIPIPDHRGRILTGESYSQIKLQLASQGIKMLYRISHGNYAVIVDSDSLKRIGIVPDGNSTEFSC